MQRELGRSGVKVSAMGAGLWAIGGPWTMGGSAAGWGEVDDAESIRAIHAALDHGITFFDTAANYGAGHSEQILGRALAGGRRASAVIATKFGYKLDPEARAVGFYGESEATADVAGHLRADCEASLRRLNTDVIDLYQFHVNTYDADRAAGVRDALEHLVQEGKIRHYGWSTDFPERARVFAQGPHCVAIQANMNVIHDSPAILAVCDEFNLACINRGPLGMGLLTGKYTRESKFAANDVRSRDWVQQGFVKPIFDNLERLRALLTSGGRTLAQGALAWLWARNPHTIPIPGVRTVAQVAENAGAMRFGPLTLDQMREVEKLLGRTAAATA
jgi:aryl-alcohol dehydrogenase-like predicted oxidoreductase